MVSRRAIVMEMSEKHLIVLTPSGEFRRVPRSGRADIDIGDEIELVSRRRVPRRAWTWSAAALVVLLLFPIVMVPTSKAEPIVAYVTLDVNPSIELGINDEEEVRELRGLNEEGKQLASGIAYKGEKAADVVASLVEKTAASNADALAAEDHDIVIASVVVGDKLDDPDQFEVQLESDIHEAVNKVVPSIENVTVLSVPKEVREEAKKNGVSTGKMAVYLMAKSQNPEMKLDSLKDQSIQEWTASEGGVQSIVSSKQKKTAATEATGATGATTSTPEPEAASTDDKQSELKDKAASNKQEKEALKALLEREKRAKARAERAAKKNGGKHENIKPNPPKPSGNEQSGLKQNEQGKDSRPTVKPGYNKGNNNPNNSINNNGVNNSSSGKQNNNTSNSSNSGSNSGNSSSDKNDDSKSSTNNGSNSSKNNNGKSTDSTNSKNSDNKTNDNKNTSKDSDNKNNDSSKNNNSSQNNNKDNNSNKNNGNSNGNSSNNSNNSKNSNSNNNDKGQSDNSKD
ncbi:anti-sigma factor-like protein [Paenibacillus cellulosilyticus]|uniref:Anti-sigma factor-like protein n=1 Tax=Paenibacillus cellulosilyticus TaxID=375489 RepID=A0A2V2YZA6_9BACL|nr:anti-sigma factor domain-containing protein [Paenibacillus cellulosilyticus]PWW07460.1 anti-sigma factor-like protein [Paenibacillus cellulosilyticus]QKS44382.1 anti-sigma factor domain-containing protein [Paenibacillus cellulosilyticus]